MFDSIYGIKIIACENMTKTIPAPPRPRIKKSNKRKTRIYLKKQPKFTVVPSDEVYQIGNTIHAHPVMIEKIKKTIEEENRKPKSLSIF